MRLWSLHPKYLDSKGLVALWRESLLAQAVLHGNTRGYRNHPQLERFKTSSSPLAAIYRYLVPVQEEATARGYHFNQNKILSADEAVSLEVTSGQLAYEWSHLMKKLEERDPSTCRKWEKIEVPEVHPLFSVRPGRVASWERP